ncbi:hypothetical protein JTM41_34750, partial [Pseudomonas aeruginosa]|nr:hypothetical protein [Pseudomonas aeruginosa]
LVVGTGKHWPVPLLRGTLDDLYRGTVLITAELGTFAIEVMDAAVIGSLRRYADEPERPRVVAMQGLIDVARQGILDLQALVIQVA